jgi:hypothetical protein
MNNPTDNNLNEYINAISTLPKNIAELVFKTRLAEYEETTDPGYKQRIFSLPATLSVHELQLILGALKDTNTNLQNDPAMLQAAKRPVNAQKIRDIYSKISTQLSEINIEQALDASGKRVPYPNFKTEMTQEFNQFNKMLFNAPDAFSYPEAPKVTSGLEGNLVSNLKQAAAHGARVIRKGMHSMYAGGEYPPLSALQQED